MHKAITKIIISDKSLHKTRKIIGKEKYDLILDIHKNFRSIYVSLFSGRIIKRYKKENFKKFLLVKFKFNFFKEVIPVYKKYLLTIKEFITDPVIKFDSTELLFSKKKIIEGKYTVISPSSRHFTKTFPADKFIEFVNSNSDLNFVLTGDNSENDIKICGYIKSKCSNTMNYCGKLSMNELANVIYYSEFVISNDSAILHFAEALEKRVIAVFGSTVKEFGFFPQLKESSVLEVNNLKCRPCTHIGRENCPEKHFRCMKEIQLTVNS